MSSFLCNPIRQSLSSSLQTRVIDLLRDEPTDQSSSIILVTDPWLTELKHDIFPHNNVLIKIQLLLQVCVCARACRSSLPEIREFRVARECHAALCRRLTLRGIFVACRRARKTNVSEMTRHLPGLGARSLLLLLVMSGSVNTGRDVRCLNGQWLGTILWCKICIYEY